MKQFFIFLSLIVVVHAQEPATPKAAKHPVINHVFQGKDTPFCATASVLMATQVITGLSIEGQELLPAMSGLYTAAAGSGKTPTWGVALAYLMNLDYRVIRHLDTVGLTIQSAKKVALEKLKTDIIPELDKGNLIKMAMISKNNLRHAVLLTSYDHANKVFLMNDPISQHAEEISLDEMADRWPYFYKDELFIYAVSFKIPSPFPSLLVKPPVDIEQQIDDQSLADLMLAGDKILPVSYDAYKKSNFYHAVNGAAIKLINQYWEKGRKADDVKGIPLWLKVKVAQGDPACLFFSKPDGSKKIVAVTGYRGGYKNFEGEMQITEIGDDGKLLNSWMKSAEVLQKGKSPRDCGGDSFYIIYPKKPLVEPAATEAKDNSK